MYEINFSQIVHFVGFVSIQDSSITLKDWFFNEIIDLANSQAGCCFVGRVACFELDYYGNGKHRDN